MLISQISKIVNSVYNTFSTRGSSSYPFVCLNIKTAREDVDVNVTPDKRNLYLMSEKSLYAIVKVTNRKFWRGEELNELLCDSNSCRFFTGITCLPLYDGIVVTLCFIIFTTGREAVTVRDHVFYSVVHFCYKAAAKGHQDDDYVTLVVTNKENAQFEGTVC